MMVSFARCAPYIRLLTVIQSLAYFHRFVLAQSPPLTCGSCIVSLPTLYDFTWSPLKYTSSTTIEVTVATLIYIIDPAGATSSSTLTHTETHNVTIPTKTNSNTIEISWGYDEEQGMELVSTVVVTYPTPFVDYGDPNVGAGYYLWTGAIFTSSSCLSVTGKGFEPASHPTYPQPTTAVVSDATDTLGHDYTLVPNYGAALPTGYNQEDFTSWYTASFSNDGAVAQCTRNNSWTPPSSPLSTISPDSTSKDFTLISEISTIYSTSIFLTSTCFTKNLTTTTCTTYTSVVTSTSVSNTVAPVFETTAFATSFSAGDASASTPESALVHTSVLFLTATSTSHISTIFASSETPGASRSVQVEIESRKELTTSSPGMERTKISKPALVQSSRPRPVSVETDGNPSSTTTKAQPVGARSSSTARSDDSVTDSASDAPASSTPNSELGSYICDGLGQCDRSPTPTQTQSTTFIVSPKPLVSTNSQIYVITASSGQPVEGTSTIVSIRLSGSQTVTALSVITRQRTASGGEAMTLSAQDVVTLNDHESNTGVIELPMSTVLTATSGQVITIPTFLLSTLTSGSQTLTSLISSSITSIAKGAEQFTLEQPITIAGSAEAHIVQLPTVNVITVTSDQVLVLPTTILSSILSGSRTVMTSFVSSYSTTATANEEIIISTNQVTTITGPVETHVVDVPTSTVVLATSGEIFTISTNVLSTITSGTGTYVTSSPTSTVVVATSNGQLITFPTETQSIVTLAAGTYTSDLAGAPQDTGTGSGLFTGMASIISPMSKLWIPILLTVVILRSG